MRYIRLPQTELTVSQIQLGSAEFGVTAKYPGMKAVSTEDAHRMMDEFIDMGGNFIDTAHVYSDWILNDDGSREFGRSEKCIGKWLASRKNRDKVMIATKGGIDFTHHTGLFGPPISLSKAELDNDIQESLQNLQTDYIDLYWLHRDEPDRPAGEIIETLNENVKKGHIRYIGCSNWTPARIAEANAYAAQHGLMPFIGNQFEWSLARMFCPEAPLDTLPYMDEEMHQFHLSTGMTAFAYSSQAHGFYTKFAQVGEEGMNDDMKQHYLNDRNRAAFRRIQKLCAETGFTPTQVALAFINSQYRFTGIPIIFSRKHEQFLDSMSAADTHLTPDMIDFLLCEE